MSEKETEGEWQGEIIVEKAIIEKWRLKIRLNAGNAGEVERNNAKREREERLAWALGGTVRRELNNRGMRDRGTRGAAQIKWEPNVTVTKALRCRQWKHVPREMFCVCVCVFTYWGRFSLPPMLPPPPSSPKHLSLRNKSQDHSVLFWTSIAICGVFSYVPFLNFQTSTSVVAAPPSNPF